MKKVTTRAYAVLLIAALVVAGMGVYLFRLIRDGGDWASFYANDSVYTGGQLNRGSVTDRNDTLLAFAGESVFGDAESADVSRACLHIVGDINGNIGTGVISLFRPEMINYSFLTGTTTDGGTVKLTIDADVCAAAYNALAGRKGTVLVYNYKTGDVICMVSTPTYDPSTGITFDLDDPAYEGVFINRAVSSTFVPGSVFKLVTMAAAIENIPDIWDQTFYCDGSTVIGGQRITCAGVHGTCTVEQGLAVSCNVVFGQVAAQLGGDIISAYAEKYGLTSSHTLNGEIPTAAGSVPSAGDDSGSAAWEGIGQYEDLVSPYALLLLMGEIANGGTVVVPSLLYGKSGGTEQLMNPSTAATLSEMMSYNVSYEYGSWTYPRLEMHAKTGTAEVGNGTTHAWFSGFITNADAPLAFVVMVERGGGGYAVASPIANTVLQKAVFG